MVVAALGLVGTLAGLVAGHRLGASGRKSAEKERDDAINGRDNEGRHKCKLANKNLVLSAFLPVGLTFLSIMQ
jgi:hypothetical protein